MAGGYLLGIDVGTTVCKAAVFEHRTGAACASAERRLPVRCEADGTREQRIDAVLAALGSAARSPRRRIGTDWRQVRAVGLAAQAGSALLADRNTGRALTAMQLWSDTRPYALLPEIAARRSRAWWRRLSRLDAPGAGLARIEWLKRRRPELFRPGAIYVGAGEFVYFALTGQWRQDPGNALQQGCYSVVARRLAPWPMRLVGEELSRVAPLRDGHETHPLSPAGARLLALPEGLPVAGPYFDHEAGYLSVAGPPGRPLQCSLGTAWVANYAHPTGSPPAAHLQFILPNPAGAGSQIVPRHAGRNGQLGLGVADLRGPAPRPGVRIAEDVFAESLLPPKGLVALPWLTQPNPLCPQHVGGGGLLGVGPHTTRADMLRAVAAGMALEFARVVQPVLDAGLVDRIVLTGGAAKGRYFRKLLAGLFAPLPVARLAEDDPGAVRGTLHAFRKRAALSHAPRAALAAPCAGEIRRRYDEYCRTCRMLAAALPDSGRLLAGPPGGRG